MGYEGNLRTMLTGHFTSLEPSFPNSGAPTLTIRGLNILHALRRSTQNNSWADIKDSEIAEQIAELTDEELSRLSAFRDFINSLDLRDFD